MNLRDLLHQLTPLPPRTHVVGLTGAAPALLLAHLWEHSPERPWCCLTATVEEAEHLVTNLSFFVPARLTETIYTFPANDAQPFCPMRMSPDIAAQRLRALEALATDARHGPCCLIAPIAAALSATIPPTVRRDYRRVLQYADTLDRDRFIEWMTEAGYIVAPLVEDIGTMAARGAIIDCWPTTSVTPIRIELEGDAIASIRAFDAASQRSQTPLDRIAIGPAEEVLFTPETRERAVTTLRRRADDADLPAPERRALAEAIGQGRRPPFLETFLPLFYGTRTTLVDYLPAHTAILFCEPMAIRAEADALRERTRTARSAAGPIAQIIAPEELYQPVTECFEQLAPHPHIHIGPDFSTTAPTMTTQPIRVETVATRSLRTTLAPAQKDQDPLTPTAEHLRQAQHDRMRTLIACHTSLAADRTIDLFRWHGLNIHAIDTDRGPDLPITSGVHAGEIRVAVGALTAGFRFRAEQLLCLTEEELFGAKTAQRSRKRPSTPATFLSFQDLEPGDFLVHEEHGIGRFLGLKHLDIATVMNDYVVIEYVGGDKLYLPVYRLHLLQRYIGSGDGMPALDRLGGVRWKKVTTKAMQSIRVMAHELLKIYAQRQVNTGMQFSGRDHALEEFETAFPYDETPDQWQAIEETLHDMQTEKPMDRLVCGDVGYGKTEVAMRAAFRAAMDGKQVAVLVPTTILAFQHYETFTARFASTALRIEMLSRFRSRDEQQAIIADCAKGTIDILIGTHRLLSKDVQLPHLGLLVIDEEQRFGVAHKERLRKLRATVDTLMLTATPIPRTLHMALGGLRDISVIQTPPADRQAIRTYVVPFDDRLIQEAIRKELHRGGEVFFVHNRVETIYGMSDHLKRLIPEARIVVAHGQMAEAALEAAMLKFVKREADVLLCTSIIESGLDIPSANTILVNRADTFGLAQLYQIRGRVGRSNVQAAAYLLIPPDEVITPTAQKRLATLARFTELGSGFSIAMHDLEIRGGGNLLGAQQSGHIAAIGYEMFTRLLEQTIRSIRCEFNQPHSAGEGGRASSSDGAPDRLTGPAPVVDPHAQARGTTEPYASRRAGDSPTPEGVVLSFHSRTCGVEGGTQPALPVGGATRAPVIDPEIALPIPAYLPEEYVTDANTRIVWYKRLSGLESTSELDEAATELQDRFGPLPPPAHALLRIIEIKQAAKVAHVDLIRYDQGTFVFRVHASAPIDPTKLTAYVAKHTTTHSLRPNGLLAVRHPCDSAEAIVSATLALLQTFTQHLRRSDLRKEIEA